MEVTLAIAHGTVTPSSRLNLCIKTKNTIEPWARVAPLQISRCSQLSCTPQENHVYVEASLKGEKQYHMTRAQVTDKVQL